MSGSGEVFKVIKLRGKKKMAKALSNLVFNSGI